MTQSYNEAHLCKITERELKMVSDQPLFKSIVRMCHLHFNSMSRQKGLCSNISHNAFNFANMPFQKGHSFAYFRTNRNKSKVLTLENYKNKTKLKWE